MTSSKTWSEYFGDQANFARVGLSTALATGAATMASVGGLVAAAQKDGIQPDDFTYPLILAIYLAGLARAGVNAVHLDENPITEASKILGGTLGTAGGLYVGLTSAMDLISQNPANALFSPFIVALPAWFCGSLGLGAGAVASPLVHGTVGVAHDAAVTANAALSSPGNEP